MASERVDPWEITDEVRKAAKGMDFGQERAMGEYRKLTPICPKDNLASEFVKFDGSYTRVRAIYKCPNGHRITRG